MSTPIGVGLHIIYGVMGSGKTNYAVNELLKSTTYKHCVLNVPLVQEFKESLPDKDFVEYAKLEPEKVIRNIDEAHQDTFFIVDEAQMVLLSANKIMVDSFCKKMSQIRQNNQCVVVIAQTSRMLPKDIKKLALDCFWFENNNIRGRDKSSKVKHYKGGDDYTTRLIDEFTFTHVYGTYESTNTPTTEKPNNLYKRTYIKIGLIFGVALLLFLFGGYKIYSFICKFTDNENESNESSFVPSILNKVDNLEQISNDTLCVRSYIIYDNHLMKVVYNTGELSYLPLDIFNKVSKCHL